ncbi:MAG: vitamin B12-dependent ribonucleotide reductase, partial [Candidatus Azambacteria bacterium]|nr:vitamin B12-dependent ribonucleotide reductase [Candidatus Azambacteria bacterium]
FIYCKKIIEDMIKILEASGIMSSIDGDLFNPYTLLPYQNANNCVRVTDEFMKKLENDENWELKAVTTGETLEVIPAKTIMDWIADATWHSGDPSMQFDTTINDWNTCSNSGEIRASNPCSEFMALDDSACNLASLNLLKFLLPDGTIDITLFKNAVTTMIVAQEIIVGNSSYPTEKITKNSLEYRALGLGYANLGSLLMNLGLSYDSDFGRITAGLITSIMTAEAYKTSAKLAMIKGPFAGYEANKEPMLKVIEKHSAEADKLAKYVDFHPNQEKKYQTPLLLSLALESTKTWKEALELGEKSGFRNAQVTLLAPTGTIAFLMDCDTTGIEPELALVKYKKLVGGGTLKLVNNQVPAALKSLGYVKQQISAISTYLLEKETIEGVPDLKSEHLPVFDCSFKAARGVRSIGYMGHIKMMGAVQPFLSGAISKTVNLPSSATVEDIKNTYIQAWNFGLKAVAIYRDGCKSVQPLNVSETKIDEKLIEKIDGHTRIKLPDDRDSKTHKFSIAGHEGYLITGLYPDTKKPGETFITIAKEGSTVSGLVATIATLTSICLQSGVPLKTLVRKFKDVRFEPSGITTNPKIRFAKSFVDYIFRYLGMKFLSEKEKEEIFGPPHVEIASDEEITNLNNGVIDTDALVCECGSMMFRAGSCYTCPNCFATTGVCN